jgi:hypothetical protein
MGAKQKITTTLLWGFGLWLLGYIAGMVLFFMVPKELIGWIITPFACAITILVLVKKIKCPKMMCYFRLGLIWMFMAIVLDYVFLIKMLNTGTAYYKADVYLYYILTLTLPIAVGYWKYEHKSPKAELF